MINTNTNGGGSTLKFRGKIELATGVILTEVTLVSGSKLRSKFHVKIQSKKYPESMDPYELGRVSYGGNSRFFSSMGG